jgi:putative oxidoreductase
MKKFTENKSESFYVVFRVIVGIVFFLHGWMKLQGINSGSIELMSLMGLAMFIEIIGGLLIVLGLFTRTTATIVALEMAYAFLGTHAKWTLNLNPLANKGEAALLFFAIALALIAKGAGKYSIDNKIKQR